MLSTSPVTPNTNHTILSHTAYKQILLSGLFLNFQTPVSFFMFSLFVRHPHNYGALLPASLLRLSELNSNPCLPFSGSWGKTFRPHCSCLIYRNSSTPEDYYLVLATYCFLSLCSTILLCGFFNCPFKQLSLHCLKACSHATLHFFFC